MTLIPWVVGAVVCVGALIGWLHLRDDNRLAEARRLFDLARQADGRRDATAALALYERCILARGDLRLPWSNWRVATHAHANAAAAALKIPPPPLRVGLDSSTLDALRTHAAAALTDEPDNPTARWARADAAKLIADYPAALRDFAVIDAAVGLGSPYLSEARNSALSSQASLLTRPLPPPAATNAGAAAAARPAASTVLAAETAAWHGLETWLRQNGAQFSPALRVSFDVAADGTGLRGVVVASSNSTSGGGEEASEHAGVVHRQLLLLIPRNCTLEWPRTALTLAGSTPQV